MTPEQRSDKAFNFLLGQVMKQTQGRANPHVARALLRQRLDEIEVRDGEVYLIGSTERLAP